MWIFWFFIGMVTGIISNLIVLYHMIMEGDEYYNGKD